MGDISNLIADSESYNPFFLDALLNDNQSNMLTDLSNNVPFSYSSLLPENPLEVNAPLPSSLINAPTSPSRNQDSMRAVTNRETSEVGPSRRTPKRCRNMEELMKSTKQTQPRNSVSSRNPTTSLAETKKPFSCGCCHVLREIIHINGLQYHKLEVHGTIGMISHAVFHYNVQGGSSRPQIFDFGKKNIEEVKFFLRNYCLNQNSLGFVLVSDPLSTYYDALCVGFEWTKNQNELTDSSVETNIENICCKIKQPQVENTNALVPPPRDPYRYRSRAEQNLRAQSMSINDFKDLFHLPQYEAARRVSLCKNVVQGIMRKGGIKNWPYKQVRNAMRQITRLRKTMSPDDPVSRATVQEGINRLKLQMVKACGGVVPTVALDA